MKIGRCDGAEIYQPKCKLPKQGNWCAPTLFANVAQSHRISQEEIFVTGAGHLQNLPHD
ncbi:MAG: hypothetical protein R2813_01790 [Flavobacteriales bacterium]